MKTHELKTERVHFQSVLDGEKLFEIRKNDRDFKKGDAVILRETVHSGHQSCQNCKFRTGTNCKKNRQSTAIFDWCRAWKFVKPCN